MHVLQRRQAFVGGSLTAINYSDAVVNGGKNVKWEKLPLHPPVLVHCEDKFFLKIYRMVVMSISENSKNKLIIQSSEQ